MSQILDERKNKVIEIGNSLGFRVKKFYLELAGMAEKNTQVTESIIIGEHGIFIGHWLPNEQPQTVKDQDLEKLKDINQKKKQ